MGLFAACASAGLIVPVPEDLPLLYAGLQIASGTWALGPTLATAIAGVWVRDIAAYSLGRLIGDWLLGRTWFVRFLGAHRIASARRMIQERGPIAVLFGRFLLGARMPVFFISGATGVQLRQFVAWDFLGLLVAVPLTVGVGAVIGQPVIEWVLWILQGQKVVLPVVAVLLIGLLLVRRRRARTPPESDDGGSL